MTEQEWLESGDARPMLDFLRNTHKLRERKVRLFAVACCRRVAAYLTDQRSITALEVAESFAEGELGVAELGAAHAAAEQACQEAVKRQAREKVSAADAAL